MERSGKMKTLEKEKTRTNNYISVCGSDCSQCYCLKEKICTGCNNCKGKVFHCSEGQECAIYACCSKHGYSSCLECKSIPCSIWNQTRDPKFSDEEFDKNINDRIEVLKNL